MRLNIPIRRLMDVKPKDILSIVPMLFALAIHPFVKNAKGDWAISDRVGGEHDNGYHFFRYLTTQHPEQPCTYYISNKSPFLNQVTSLGATKKYGGLRHWIAYFSSEYLITSQGCRPNEHLCTIIERMGFFRPPRVFLQHGVTNNRPPYLMSDKLAVKYFVTTAAPETKDIQEKFGYPEGTVVFTGFPRFDALHDLPTSPRFLLIMPTWRKWLSERSERFARTSEDLSLQSYVHAWMSLLDDERLLITARESGLEIILFLHNNMRDVINTESLFHSGIKCAKSTDDLQHYMKNSMLLITDYSSVCFDFAYMKKQSIYYQFDEAKFRKYHYPQGWFDYHSTSLGTLCTDVDSVISTIRLLSKNGFRPSDSFLAEHSQTFPLYDTKNSERLYYFLKNETKDRSNSDRDHI